MKNKKYNGIHIHIAPSSVRDCGAQSSGIKVMSMRRVKRFQNAENYHQNSKYYKRMISI